MLNSFKVVSVIVNLDLKIIKRTVDKILYCITLRYTSEQVLF